MARVINRLLLVLLLSGATQAGHREAASFTLLARSSARPVQPVLTPEQRQWREGRQELVLGTSAPDYPPFDIQNISMSPAETALTTACTLLVAPSFTRTLLT